MPEREDEPAEPESPAAGPPARKKLLLRLDPAVYDAIAKWAADDLRSVNAQIEYALRLSLKQAGRDPRNQR
ncbi:hypothetical protein [Nonomuraea sp. NPDC048916]|uniref:hypothetical protein n=1 Tax=Nonomuraea sp. NPDC048916 TaxID=3154232 RepID=UPI0033D799D3